MRFSTLSLILALVLSFAAPLQAAIVVPPPATTEADTPTKAEVAAATAEYKAKLAAMTAKERRAFKKEQKRDLKQALKQYKQDVKNGVRDADTNTLLLVILAILLPPVAVLVHQGELNTKFWIALILTLLFYLPGLIYALLVIFGNAKKK
nr:YqaE/Pmp3 family membrane protein [Neolewinella aurantiaca]